MYSIDKWLDRHGLIRTKANVKDSGNGMTFSELYCELFPEDKGNTIVLEARMGALWNRKRGLLYRTPDNAYGQESHDNYTTFLTMLFRTGRVKLARSVLWGLVRRFGYMKNVPWNLSGRPWTGKDGKIDTLLKPWIGRFPQVWIMALVSAVPFSIVRFFARYALLALMRFDALNLSDASGTQLQFQRRHTLLLLGDPAPMTHFMYQVHGAGVTLADVMSTPRIPTDVEGYWAQDHIVVAGYKRYEGEA